jgi:putative endonuclease
MQKTYNRKIGDLGERIAKGYLQKRGYRIIEQNYHNRYVEIDLIAWDKKCLVFVEVRTKIGEKFGRPEDTFVRQKIKRLVRGAIAYVAFNVGARHAVSLQYRIDAICIVLDENNNPRRITHHKNITLQPSLFYFTDI